VQGRRFLAQHGVGQRSDAFSKLVGPEVLGRRLAIHAGGEQTSQEADRVAFESTRIGGPCGCQIRRPEDLYQVQELRGAIGKRAGLEVEMGQAERGIECGVAQ